MRKTTSSKKPDLALPATDLPLLPAHLKRPIHCVICGSETQAGSPESMCWVCRRLKISAWRDVEQQMPAQE